MIVSSFDFTIRTIVISSAFFCAVLVPVNINLKKFHIFFSGFFDISNPLCSLSIFTIAFLFRFSGIGLIVMITVAVSYLDTLSIASTILLIGSSHIFL